MRCGLFGRAQLSGISEPSISGSQPQTQLPWKSTPSARQVTRRFGIKPESLKTEIALSPPSSTGLRSAQIDLINARSAMRFTPIAWRYAFPGAKTDWLHPTLYAHTHTRIIIDEAHCFEISNTSPVIMRQPWTPVVLMNYRRESCSWAARSSCSICNPAAPEGIWPGVLRLL
jgi:hypothetical protein